jgi:DNA (cytosine-5)-methyltransferase 1
LDLFCGAGGCARGYHAAGFQVFGVDTSSARLRHYPYPHVQADALDYAEKHGHMFDVIHASPPCQLYSISHNAHTKQHPDLLAPTRDILRRLGVPYVIENVPGAPMPDAMTLCGTMFDLTAVDIDGVPIFLRRHRLFESDLFLYPPNVCRCVAFTNRGWRTGGVYGNGSDSPDAAHARQGGYTPRVEIQRALMGLDLPRDHLNQAIPPAYTQYIGEQLLDHLRAAA